MNKQHILGFFDDLVRTPVFLFLCAMFLCGAAAGGLTGLRAGEGDGAAVLSGLLAELPAHVVQSTLCALIWVLLPLVCAFLRPRELLLSAVAAARGFVLAMTVAVSVGEGNALIIGAAGVPAVLSVSALLAACSMVFASNVQDAVFPVCYACRAKRPSEGRDSGTVQCVIYTKCTNAQRRRCGIEN